MTLYISNKSSLWHTPLIAFAANLYKQKENEEAQVEMINGKVLTAD